ncbi:Importin subunit alpha-2 [Citrus sinensis]|nr:Importin subunit alpha-2 [Citrus sinensis]
MKVVQIGGHPKRFSKEKAENGMKVFIRDANKYCDLKHILKQESSITNNLVILRVSSCQHLINLVPSWTTFQNLTTLGVSGCGRLRNVLTSSIAKTLVRLREMTIQSCVMITEIIVADDNVAAKDEVVAFSKLKELKLLYLESLTSFCSSNCALKFPSLEILLVHECPNMKIFSEGELSTPKLHKVQLWYEACWFWKGDLNKTIQQLEATTLSRKLLSFDRNPPIEKVIQSGVVPRFVEFLMREDYPQLQYEAAWVLINIASGTSENTNVVIDHGAVPIFVKLLSSPSDDVREQAVWALGNVAGDSPRCRDLVLSQGALIPLLAELNEHAKLSMLRNATRTLSNFCRGKPEPPFDQVRPALPALAQLVHSNDEDVLTDACWSLSYLADGTNDKIQAVIEAGVCPRLVELLGHPSPSVLSPALRTVGNIVTGDDFQTQCIINHGAVPYLLDMLVHNHEEIIKKEISWIISNITAGNREQIQAVIDAGLIRPIVNLLQNAEFDTKKEAAWAISNATSGGTQEQIKHLVREGCVKPLCDLLLCSDPEIVTVCLIGLENILKVGEAERNMGTTIGDVNQYAQFVEEAGGLEKIENLQSHDNNEIHEKSVKIFKTYWCGRVVGLSLVYRMQGMRRKMHWAVM